MFVFFPTLNRKTFFFSLLPTSALVWALGIGCFHAPQEHLTPWDEISVSQKRERMAIDARNWIGSKHLRVGNKKFPFDCSGFVATVLYQNGIDVYQGASELDIRGRGVQILYEFVSRYGELFRDFQAQPGDLVFFSNTLDRNHDRKANDEKTHVAIIEKIEEDQTFVLIHKRSQGIQRMYMNLNFPNQFKDSKQKILNSYLRRRSRKDLPQTSYLAGELFSEFGSLIK